MTQKLVIFSVEMHPFIGIRETVLNSFNENNLMLDTCPSLYV